MSIFEAQHIGVQYWHNKQPFAPFSDISFALEGGRIYNLTGPSGSGKSTLLNACSLMIPRTHGDMLLYGASYQTFKPNEWRRHVCLVPQASSMVPGTVRDNLLFPWTLKINEKKPRPTDDELLKMMQRADLNNEVTLDQLASQLSGGQQARIALIRAFVTHPMVFLLDEVEAALDDESAVAISELTRKLLTKDTACMRIRHRAEDGYAYGVYTLANGKITYQQNKITDKNKPVTT